MRQHNQEKNHVISYFLYKFGACDKANHNCSLTVQICDLKIFPKTLGGVIIGPNFGNSKIAFRIMSDIGIAYDNKFFIGIMIISE